MLKCHALSEVGLDLFGSYLLGSEMSTQQVKHVVLTWRRKAPTWRLKSSQDLFALITLLPAASQLGFCACLVRS